jgi:hypothetical protein
MTWLAETPTRVHYKFIGNFLFNLPAVRHYTLKASACNAPNRAVLVAPVGRLIASFRMRPNSGDVLGGVQRAINEDGSVQSLSAIRKRAAS